MPVTLAQVSKELIEMWAEVAQNVLHHCQRTGVYRLKGETMATTKTRSKKIIEDAMSEVHTNVPSTVKATGKTGAEKEKMLAAVAFSKAKDKGAKVPRKGSKASY